MVFLEILVLLRNVLGNLYVLDSYWVVLVLEIQFLEFKVCVFLVELINLSKICLEGRNIVGDILIEVKLDYI